MQIIKRPEDAETQPAGANPKRGKKKHPKGGGKKISPGTIAKLVRHVYKNEPERLLDFSPDLFRVLSESERETKKLDRQSYFENYITERERHDLHSKLMSLSKNPSFNKQESVKFLELAVPLGVEKERFFEPLVFKALETLGVDFTKEKDSVKQIKRGEAANRVEVYRGVILSYDWSGSLLEISLMAKDIAIRKSAHSLIGSLSWSPDPVAGAEAIKRKMDDAKFVVIEDTALASMLNSQDQNQKRTSTEFMRMIDSRSMILCAVESLISILSMISLNFGIPRAKEIATHAMRSFRIVSSLPLAKDTVFQLVLSEACRGIKISSLQAILLAKMTGAPLFTTDSKIIDAWNSEEVKLLLGLGKKGT
jgi:hypothetical protein